MWASSDTHFQFNICNSIPFGSGWFKDISGVVIEFVMFYNSGIMPIADISTIAPSGS